MPAHGPLGLVEPLEQEPHRYAARPRPAARTRRGVGVVDRPPGELRPKATSAAYPLDGTSRQTWSIRLSRRRAPAPRGVVLRPPSEAEDEAARRPADDDVAEVTHDARASRTARSAASAVAPRRRGRGGCRPRRRPAAPSATGRRRPAESGELAVLPAPGREVAAGHLPPKATALSSSRSGRSRKSHTQRTVMRSPSGRRGRHGSVPLQQPAEVGQEEGERHRRPAELVGVHALVRGVDASAGSSTPSSRISASGSSSASAVASGIEPPCPVVVISRPKALAIARPIAA